MKDFRQSDDTIEGQHDGLRMNKKREAEESLEECILLKRQCTFSKEALEMLSDRNFVRWVIKDFRLLPTQNKEFGMIIWSEEENGKWNEMRNLEMSTWLRSISNPNLELFKNFLEVKWDNIRWEDYPVDVLGNWIVRQLYHEYNSSI